MGPMFARGDAEDVKATVHRSFPVVMVPVLSRAMVELERSVSSTPVPRISMPLQGLLY